MSMMERQYHHELALGMQDDAAGLPDGYDGYDDYYSEEPELEENLATVYPSISAPDDVSAAAAQSLGDDGDGEFDFYGNSYGDFEQTQLDYYLYQQSLKRGPTAAKAALRAMPDHAGNGGPTVETLATSAPGLPSPPQVMAGEDDVKLRSRISPPSAAEDVPPRFVPPPRAVEKVAELHRLELDSHIAHIQPDGNTSNRKQEQQQPSPPASPRSSSPAGALLRKHSSGRGKRFQIPAPAPLDFGLGGGVGEDNGSGDDWAKVTLDAVGASAQPITVKKFHLPGTKMKSFIEDQNDPAQNLMLASLKEVDQMPTIPALFQQQPQNQQQLRQPLRSHSFDATEGPNYDFGEPDDQLADDASAAFNYMDINQSAKRRPPGLNVNTNNILTPITAPQTAPVQSRHNPPVSPNRRAPRPLPDPQQPMYASNKNVGKYQQQYRRSPPHSPLPANHPLASHRMSNMGRSISARHSTVMPNYMPVPAAIPTPTPSWSADDVHSIASPSTADNDEWRVVQPSIVHPSHRESRLLLHIPPPPRMPPPQQMARSLSIPHFPSQLGSSPDNPPQVDTLQRTLTTPMHGGTPWNPPQLHNEPAHYGPRDDIGNGEAQDDVDNDFDDPEDTTVTGIFDPEPRPSARALRARARDPPLPLTSFVTPDHVAPQRMSGNIRAITGPTLVSTSNAKMRVIPIAEVQRQMELRRNGLGGGGGGG
ncbi:hypothetical protein HK101_004019, partial [Irineochytrium annulatum]